MGSTKQKANSSLTEHYVINQKFPQSEERSAVVVLSSLHFLGRHRTRGHYEKR